MLAYRLAAALLAVALIAPPSGAQAEQYTLTNVSQAEPGNVVGLGGLSDTGFVCGWSISAASPFDSKGFRWSASGTFFPPPPAGVEWKTFNALDVNDRGTLVGYFGVLSPNSFLRGYCTQAGVSTELLTPLGHRAFPSRINDLGWIVGYAGIEPAATPGAIVWTPDLVPSFVSHLDSALDINNRGQIVGFGQAVANETTSGFLVDGPRVVPLGSLDPAGLGSVVPWAINDAGTVVGYSVIGPAEHAFRWTAATGMTELPGLGFNVFPFNVAAVDINEQGDIVGYAPGPNGQTGVLWRKDGTIHALEPMVPAIGLETNWPNLLHVMRINSAGQITAMAAHKPSSYQARVVLLTPAELHAALRETADGGAHVLDVDGASPFEPVYLAAGPDDPMDTGYTPLPGCAPIGLALATPRLLAKVQSDGGGHASFAWTMPPGLAGQVIRLQAYQSTACKVSNVVRLAP